MTLYSLLKKISAIITPETDAFYNYAIHTSDDNGGFLRTRYCWRLDNPVEDFDLDEGYSKVMVTAQKPIEEQDLLDETEPQVKMQITYSIQDADIGDAEWDAELSYCYVYIFDLVCGTYSMKCLNNICLL